ncbi:D-alanyl-D-alanine carboxypeptidase [Xanthobacter tagetidis]|uniref:D-alanyl-D-alanine carboxypeptidase n=1 Tax=Xanthobacter tagetidis TaxID=60216 RepID=A0A3L7A522_9HYPH|nr:D-alanyl-D-alanine carboxypeptidase [Xanthobacter tagetidis]
MRIASANAARGLKVLAVAVLASFAFTSTLAEAKPRKRNQVERSTQRKSAPAPVADADGARWRYGSSAIMVDGKTGRVLYEDNADALRHPASVTKVMTLYLLFEQMEAGRLRVSSALPVSSRAASQSPTKLNLRPGSTIEVEDAIKALVTRSANDAAVVIAEAIGGSETEFAQMMTAKARALGMSRTTFRNASGLPNPGQVTTARDLSILGRAIQDRFPRQYRYFATRTFYYRGEAIGNHNRLLGRIEGVDGIKTGYTRASGFNLLTSVKADDRYLVGVVLGGSSGRARDNRMADLIEAHLPRAYAGVRTAPRVIENAAATPEERPVGLAFAAPLPQPQPVAREDDRTALTAPPPAPARWERGAEPAAKTVPVPVAAPAKPAPVPLPVAAPRPKALPEPVQALAQATLPPAAAAQVAAATATAAPAHPAARPADARAADPAVTASIGRAAAPAPEAGATSASAMAASAEPVQTAAIGSDAPIKPTGVKTIAVKRATAATASATASAAGFVPAGGALGYAGPTQVSQFSPPTSAFTADGRPNTRSAARANAKSDARLTPNAPVQVQLATALEPSPEEVARYEASVWPVLDVADTAATSRRTDKPALVRTASLTPTPLPPAAATRTQIPASARSGWIIQVGAFDGEKQARARLDAARAKAKALLAKADAYTETVAKGSGQLYRARFSGLDEKGAREACRLLQRNDFGCMTLKN